MFHRPRLTSTNKTFRRLKSTSESCWLNCLSDFFSAQMLFCETQSKLPDNDDPPKHDLDCIHSCQTMAEHVWKHQWVRLDVSKDCLQKKAVFSTKQQWLPDDNYKSYLCQWTMNDVEEWITWSMPFTTTWKGHSAVKITSVLLVIRITLNGLHFKTSASSKLVSFDDFRVYMLAYVIFLL